jgi:aquaporin Z
MAGEQQLGMTTPAKAAQSAGQALATHWPEYLIEATCLGTFMVSTCVFSLLLGHPDSPLDALLPNGIVRRWLAGAAMGLTAIALIYSPIGRRSGAHMNPAVTFIFFRLGKVCGWDAFFYAASQFIGGALGVFLVLQIAGSALAHKMVNYAITAPSHGEVALALFAEMLISFLMMTAVLNFSNRAKLAPYTGIAAGTLVMLFITFESPISGMSMNPARTFASDVVGMQWNAVWIYFVAPLLGMLAAAEVFVRTRGAHAVICAKLNHSGTSGCIFRCGYMRSEMRVAATRV